jgi:hypothetical protein
LQNFIEGFIFRVKDEWKAIMAHLVMFEDAEERMRVRLELALRSLRPDFGAAERDAKSSQLAADLLRSIQVPGAYHVEI